MAAGGGWAERASRWVPGVAAARGYERRWLSSDVVAGIVLAAILVPQGMAYSALGPLIFAAVTPLVVAGDDPATAVALAGMLAVLVGLVEIGLGAGKLGFVADLLSSEVQVGYMNGLAIVIIVGQLPKLSGFSTDADSFVGEVQEFVTNFDQ